MDLLIRCEKRRLSNNNNNNVVLPTSDVIMDNILTRLPVKSLLRFRCVSKYFCAQIDSPDFIKKHLNYSIESKTNHNLIVTNFYSIRSVDLYLLDQALDIKHSFEYNKFTTSQILGSVNGLLCLLTGGSDILIWNPATKKYRIVSRSFVYSIAYGFGYDSVSDDYKILSFRMIRDYNRGLMRCIPAVYSWRSHSWQFLQKFPYHIHHYNAKGRGVLVCGALHFCVKESHAYDSLFLIASFDLATNCFSLVDPPHTLNKEFNNVDKKLFDVTIGQLGGQLCVVCHYYCDSHIDVWVMKNYRVKESWIKLCSISRTEVIGSFYNPFSYSKRGDEIMLVDEDGKLFWYNLEKKIMKKIEVRDYLCGYLNMTICVESLVDPNAR